MNGDTMMSSLDHDDLEHAARHRITEHLAQRLSAVYSEGQKRDCDIFLMRFTRYFADFYQPLALLYGGRPDFDTTLDALAESMLNFYIARNEALKLRDLERGLTPDWFEAETMVGYIFYTDLFAGTLRGVRDHLDYLRDLGLTYIHLMPLLKPRAGVNDGGYAVEDYHAVDPRLGTIADMEDLATDLHANGMNMCIDFVLNHTAKEHEWARKAYAGDPDYLDYYFAYDDRTVPDAFERTLPEVFPDFAPGNFTWYDGMAGTPGKWVWTTFNEFQWDLNYTNPAVFRGMVENILFLANKGVDILRIDAAPFIWKRLGTDCQNQPEVHDLLQAFRGVVRIVAPAMIFKAEAIVSPGKLVPYLGVGRHSGKECELAYNNSLMVLLWSSLASRKVAVMTHSLAGIPQTPRDATWITYARLHDDIGWAITDENATAVGENGFLHRQFLYRFYAGEFPGSFARGAIFQFNPATLDGRTSGSTASLAGLERAQAENNPYEMEMAIRRIVLLHSVILSYGGIPLIYMGDEIGLLNDYGYTRDPIKADDNRWMHRPPMDWTLAATRTDPATAAGRIYGAVQQLIRARTTTPALHSSAFVQPLYTDSPHIFAYTREHPRGRMLCLANFSEAPQSVSADVLWRNGMSGNARNILAGQSPAIWDNRLTLAPYESLWLLDEF